jgi:hypothetical protein
MESLVRDSIRDNILNIYRGIVRDQANPNRSGIRNNYIHSVYYNDLSSEHNYIIPSDDDDFTSTILIDIVTNFGSPGNDSFLKTLRKNKIKDISYRKIKKNDPLLEETCSICLDDFKYREFHKELSCKHNFHKKCIDRWFNKDHSDCPMCRSKVIS